MSKEAPKGQAPAPRGMSFLGTFLTALFVSVAVHLAMTFVVIPMLTQKPAPKVKIDIPTVLSGQHTVPSLTKIPLKKARERIRQAGLRIGKISFETDEDIAPSFVLRQSPSAGRLVTPLSKVDLVVNKAAD